jgi:hypothetical protein
MCREWLWLIVTRRWSSPAHSRSITLASPNSPENSSVLPSAVPVISRRLPPTVAMKA